MEGLSIIIVNYKTPGLVKNCLDSIYNAPGNFRPEIIIVDNHSQDGSESITKGLFHEVKWIQLPYNAGFARANNAGIRESSGDVVLLLNSDTINVDNAIYNCYESFRSGKYVACGVQLLNADGSPQISGNFVMKGGLNNLLPLPYVGAFLKRIGNMIQVRKPHVPDTSSEVVVDWINGAFLMVRKAVILKAGMMDEDFFLYAEEAEWCHRLKKLGPLAIFGQYKVIHLQGETSSTAFQSETKGYYNLFDRKGLQIMLSNFVRIRKEFGKGWFVIHLFIYTITIPIYFVGLLIKFLFSFRYPLHDVQRFKGFFKNMKQVWHHFFKIYTNKPYFYKIL